MTLTVNSYTDVGELQPKQHGRRTTTESVATVTDDTSSTGTCRCLFGPVDRTDNAATLASLRAFMYRISAARWGYDFSAGRPLPGGRFEWTEVDTITGNDVRDRAVLQRVDSDATPSDNMPVTSSEFLTSSSSSSPPMKRHRPAVTSSQRRRRKLARFDDVIRNVVVCTPASQQHRNARCRRHIITGTYKKKHEWSVRALISRQFLSKFLSKAVEFYPNCSFFLVIQLCSMNYIFKY